MIKEGRFSRRVAFRICSRKLANKGFTLVEVLLATALSGIILVSAASLLWNVSEIYFTEQNKPSYDVHSRNVGRFVEHLFYSAVLPQAQNNNSRNQQSQSSLVKWESLPGDTLAEKDHLSFEYQKKIPLLYWEDGPLPAITAWLSHEEGEGLFLLWQTVRQKKEDPDDYFRTLISPHITEMHFQYYDEDTDDWDEDKDFMEANKPLPDMVTLIFEWEDEYEDTVNVLLPPEISGAPLY